MGTCHCYLLCNKARAEARRMMERRVKNPDNTHVERFLTVFG